MNLKEMYYSVLNVGKIVDEFDYVPNHWKYELKDEFEKIANFEQK